MGSNPPFGSKKDTAKRDVFFVGGGGRIRTIEAKRSRFTVCPLWPLGNSPIFCSFGCRLKECAGSGGAGRRTRTPDLLITNQLLYQLSYTGGSRGTRVLYHGFWNCQALFVLTENFFISPGRSAGAGRIFNAIWEKILPFYVNFTKQPFPILHFDDMLTL